MTTIQFEDDTKLKEAIDILNKQGVSIGSAFESFFDAVIEAQGLPFKNDDQQSMIYQMAEFFANRYVYRAPQNSNADTVVVLPLEENPVHTNVPVAMYAQLVEKIPAGKISTWEDIRDYLGKLYGVKIPIELNSSLLKIDENNKPIPYWRIVSNKGILGAPFTSREEQKRLLEAEGLPVVQRGHMEGSYKVPDFKKYLFDFGGLKTVKAE